MEAAPPRPLPYGSSFDHLLAEIERIDLLLRAQVSRVQRAMGGGAAGGPPDVEGSDKGTPDPPSMQESAARRMAESSAREAESRRRGVALRLSILADTFGLAPFDVDVLLIGLAPEIDAHYERTFAYLQGDPSQKHPGVDLAFGLLCTSHAERLAARRRFAAEAPLLRHGLIHLFTDPPRLRPPLLGASFKVDDRIVEYLHDSDDMDRALMPFARKVKPERALSDLLLPGSLKDRLSRLAEDRGAALAPGQVIYLQGPYGVGKRTTAEALCRALGKNLLIVDGPSLEGVPDETAAIVIRAAVRETLLLDAALLWEGFDLLLASEKRSRRTTLLRAIGEAGGLTFLAGEASFEPTDAVAARFIRIELGLPTQADQAQLWATALGPDARLGPDVELAQLTGRYRLSGGQIRDAAATARDLCHFRDPGGGQITMDELSRASRIHSSPRLSTLGKKVTARNAWEDLVLPRDRLDRLREICNHARYRARVFDEWGFDRKLQTGKGLSLMFTGPPGTGKTMTARVMAGELGLDLYQIDLSGVVSKYIGETEKQLARIFAEAEQSHAILFFDEADALFGKRTEVHDAHDRYANIETSYLLQQMEGYEGVVILATNFSRNIDEAFVRRIQFIIDFAVPGERERLALWQRIWPEGMPRAEGLDLAFMARRFELAGGHIRNIALAAAFLAAAEGKAVTQKHLLHATRREYQKMGRVADEGMFVYRP